jgi:ABC-type transport system involved in multi-copper enzyme maturation permease subunit
VCVFWLFCMIIYIYYFVDVRTVVTALFRCCLLDLHVLCVCVCVFLSLLLLLSSLSSSSSFTIVVLHYFFAAVVALSLSILFKKNETRLWNPFHGRTPRPFYIYIINLGDRVF